MFVISFIIHNFFVIFLELVFEENATCIPLFSSTRMEIIHEFKR